jgi:uncharacterized membrane protein
MTTTLHGTCIVCQKQYPFSRLHPCFSVRNSLLELIRKDFPNFGHGDYICTTDLNIYRSKYIGQLMQGEGESLNQFEEEILDNLKKEELYVQKLYDEYDRQLTYWDKLADRIASFGGSWKFISIFGGFILLWIAINIFLLTQNAFDPYPFILLNLILSCLAALQAPVIMMSQNRMEERDRMRAENDFKINMKAEIEIKILHEKIDHLINNQWQKLLEIQQIQIELMEEMRKKEK